MRWTVASTTKTKKTVEKKGDKVAKLAAKKAKSHSDALFKKAAGMIKKLTSEELPKRTTKRKVALKCPTHKKPGNQQARFYQQCGTSVSLATARLATAEMPRNSSVEIKHEPRQWDGNGSRGKGSRPGAWPYLQKEPT